MPRTAKPKTPPTHLRIVTEALDALINLDVLPGVARAEYQNLSTLKAREAAYMKLIGLIPTLLDKFEEVKSELEDAQKELYEYEYGDEYYVLDAAERAIEEEEQAALELKVTELEAQVAKLEAQLDGAGTKVSSLPSSLDLLQDTNSKSPEPQF